VFLLPVRREKLGSRVDKQTAAQFAFPTEIHANSANSRRAHQTFPNQLFSSNSRLASRLTLEPRNLFSLEPLESFERRAPFDFIARLTVVFVVAGEREITVDE
jgi:hypothetical protein